MAFFQGDTCSAAYVTAGYSGCVNIGSARSYIARRG
jgi:hypothetical protein